MFVPAKSTFCAAVALVIAMQPQSGPRPAVSPHWAGYVAIAPRPFTAVQARWVEPRIRCGQANSSAAFWIGLGGAGAAATGLEQIGTLAECSDRIVPSYSAWYELIPVPAAPVDVPLTIRPGDRLAAQVSAHETTITLAIENRTTGRSFSTQVTAPSVDLASAEWIAEAPPFCLIWCEPLPLADFGTVTFEGATAVAGAHTGGIGDSAWTHHSIRLATAPQQPAAIPSALSSNDRSFSIRWRDARQSHRGP